MNNKELEIRIADLFAMMLKKARLILCLLLICALLGCAYGVFSALKAVPAVTEEDVKNAETAVKSAEQNVINAEKALIRRNEVEIPDAERKLERAELLVKRRQDYLEKSIYYAMNPFERGVSRLTFYVETDFTVDPNVVGLVEDPQASIVLAYTQIYPFDTEILDNVRKILKTDAEKQYIEELISVSSISDRFVKIQVINDDAQLAERVVNYLYQTMLNRLKGTVAEHSANVIGTFTGYEVDWDMNDSHTQNEDNLIAAERGVTSANESLQDLRDGVKDKEQAIEDAKDALSKAQNELEDTRKKLDNSQVNVKNTIKKSAKYGLIGLVLGFVAGCGIALIDGLLGGRIQNQNEIINRYDFPLIGILPRTKKVWFDKTIRRLEGEPVSGFEATAQATMQSLLTRIGERSVCLVSSGNRAAADRLSEYTENKVKAVGSIINDAESVKELADYDGIVLVEERGLSRIDLVDAEVLRAKALNKDILGIILA